MSAVDPLAALAAQLAATQGGADVALDLGAVAQILQAQLNLGDVLAATVLAPQGGLDLIEILGQTVVAQLPPDVRPGETLLLQVTGFAGNQIIVRNLGVADPGSPLAVFVPEVPPQPGNAVATAAVLTTISNPNSQAQTPPVGIPPAANGTPVAPPAAVFVAASIKQPAATADAHTPGAPAPVIVQRLPSATQSIAAPTSINVESRLAATRAATADGALQTPQPARITEVPSRPVLASTVAPPIVPRPAVPVHIARATFAPVAPQAAIAPAATPLVSKDPVSLLAALRVPATPITLAAARIASTAGEAVQTALQNLQSVLEQGAPSDARVATLQTLSSFIGRFDAKNPQTLAAQISSFVSNVLEGAEHKLSALLQALVPRDGARAQGPVAGAHLPAHVRSAAPAHAQIISQAHAAERQAAITQDLKSTLLSLVASPPGGATPQLTQAITQTLTALTAMQFNALAGAQHDPNTIALSIPMVFFDGGQSASVRIFRDAPKSKGQRMDADNFHIAFVLDTQALGTVAIDLETVGRAVKVAVKTDRASAVEPFNTSLADLRARLEHLRYNVTSTQAEMVSLPVVAAAPVAAPKTTNVDLRA